MRVLVIGSINVDLTTITNVIPAQGETVIGKSFHILPGGKGANQAVAAARLGGNVSFYGKVGRDNFANYSLDNFKKNKVNTDHITKVKGTTGIANIIVNNNENRIIVNKGANGAFDINKFKLDIIDQFDVFSLQYEIDIDFTHYIISQAHKKDKIIVLNPTPYNKQLTKDIIEKVTYLIVSKSEAIMMFGNEYQEMMKEYPNKIIVTLGSNGAIYYDGFDFIQVISENVPIVDTTGADDTFCGAFIAAISEGTNLRQAIMKAGVAATYSVQKLGAQSAMPWKGDI